MKNDSTATYAPCNGFSDLTERPKGMTAQTHKKIQGMQMLVIAESKKYNDPEIRKNNQRSYDYLREHAAKLQQVILANWGDALFY